MSTVLKSGRLKQSRRDVADFISSIDSDRRIATASVLVNEAHVLALYRAGAIGRADSVKLVRALRAVKKSRRTRRRVEDIHVLIEEEVTRHAGEVLGGMLHTGKSRNDQVVTAIRMVLRDSLLSLSSRLLSLERELLRIAWKHRESLFVGYTHLQPAQPITFAHYLLAVGDAILRDVLRLRESYGRVNHCPMGAGALAGSSFRIDRLLTARLLGFDGIVENSLDATGTRDFVLEALAVFGLVALDFSRLAQDLIFYGSSDVGILEWPDSFTSTSSMMPQKKNPDVLELIRARCGRVASAFSTAAGIVHALPSGYNLDFQELTPMLWDSLDTLNSCLDMFIGLMGKVAPSEGIGSRQSLRFIVATEVANTLSREANVPFRTAHHLVGKAVRLAMERGQGFSEIDQADWERLLGRKLDEVTARRLSEAAQIERSYARYRTLGSPNPRETRRLIHKRLGQAGQALARNSQDRAKVLAGLSSLRNAIR